MAVNGQHLLVTDAAHAYVQVFDKTTGAFVSRFGGKGEGDENLEKPEGISVAPDFVSDYSSGEVKIYGEDYKWLKTFSEYGAQPGQNIESEFGDIYEANFTCQRPAITASAYGTWTADSNSPSVNLARARASSTIQNQRNSAAKARCIVADLKNDRIQVFDPGGKFLTTWGYGRRAWSVPRPCRHCGGCQQQHLRHRNR